MSMFDNNEWIRLLLSFMTGVVFGGITFDIAKMKISKPKLYHWVCDSCGAAKHDPSEMACEECGNYTLVKRSIPNGN